MQVRAGAVDCYVPHCIDIDLYVTVQEKVAALRRMADDAVASMNNELRVQLVKIPKQVHLVKLLYVMLCYTFARQDQGPS